ncbi:hypothetical protein P8629_07025 [Hydrogenovibrio sp. 3SP14C1]|uniref:hypothetical protein n=1 Tax=Hydrogenovibrio sp. 3SP14C1 TaxID=3038774 RepID=UPI002415B662|nr:hypothetical protein [Hydrogenovibrio sp. 3SP14C1]MDG4812758.1 hypothetical protein [Hydrogenovibrio sp. 3SP14C1]
MKFTIQPGKSQPVDLEHRFLRVLYASAAFEVKTPNAPEFELRNKQAVDLRDPMRITLINRQSVEITVELQTSAYEIKELDSVVIAEGSKVDLVDGASIDVGTVQIAQDAQIAIKPGSDVAINNLPSVQTVDGQVNIGTLPAVQVSQLPNVTIGHKVEKDTSGQLVGLPQISFDTAAKTLAGNVSRKHLEIQASINNTGEVWVGSTVAGVGIPLGKGESYDGEITADLNLFATALNDKVNVMEVIGV